MRCPNPANRRTSEPVRPGPIAGRNQPHLPPHFLNTPQPILKPLIRSLRWPRDPPPPDFPPRASTAVSIARPPRSIVSPASSEDRDRSATSLHNQRRISIWVAETSRIPSMPDHVPAAAPAHRSGRVSHFRQFRSRRPGAMSIDNRSFFSTAGACRLGPSPACFASLRRRLSFSAVLSGPSRLNQADEWEQHCLASSSP